MKIHQISKTYLCLLDTQVEIVLKGLEMYLAEINSKYNYRKVSLTLAENIEKSLARDTYNQILYCKNKKNKKIS